MFEKADADDSATLSSRELKVHLQHPRVKAYFAALDIDPSEADIIFTLLDVDKSGEISIDEFVNGTMKLKGHAKNLDIMSMMDSSVKQAARFSSHCAYVESEFYELKRLMLNPGQENSEAPRIMTPTIVAPHGPMHSTSPDAFLE